MGPVPNLCEPVTVTIANGQSITDAINLGGRVVAGVFMPAAWTEAGLSFQAAPSSGGTFADIITVAGEELTVTAAAGQYLALEPINFLGVNHLKVRSGTSGTAVNQGAEREIVLMVGTPDRS